MTELRDALERLADQAPPPRDRFDEELWERVRAGERAARRRWRVATVAAATVAAAAVGATAVFALRGAPAGTTVDRTISCRMTTALSSATVGVGAGVTEPGPDGDAFAGVSNGQLTFAGAGKSILPATGEKLVTRGYYLDRTVCSGSRAKVPLAPSGLRSLGVFSRAGNAQMGEDCSVASNSAVTIRLRVVLSKPGVPVSAQLAVRGGKHPHPLAFVSWTPKRFRAYVAPGCEQS